MDRNKIMWILDCCVFALDNISKQDMEGYGASSEEADIGIKICDYLKNKEIAVELTNGH